MPPLLTAGAKLPATHTVDAASVGHVVDSVDQIAYCSIATPSVHALGLPQLMLALGSLPVLGETQSHPHSLTGILMWEGRLMIHWLEGSRDALDAFWARIENDPRQHCVVPLLRRHGTTQRLFTAWKMQPTSRNEMMAIVREAKEQASRSDDPQALQWQHAISTLSILLDGELTAYYSQATGGTNRPESTP